MKYLKLFDTESNYLAYRDDKSKYLKPNVSLSDDNGSVYYNFTPPPIVYEAIDLDLPSGTKWAAQNVGAYKPTDAGFYFQWGDTSGYTADQVGKDKQFASDWSDYKWSIDGSSSNFRKYTTTGATLELEDDAAHVNMGGDWHMPTRKQIEELTANTTSTWTAQDGVNGRLFTSKTDPSKSIFIPAAGFAMSGSLINSGGIFYVWSSMLSNGISHGFSLYANSYYISSSGNPRYVGASVRGVIG